MPLSLSQLKSAKQFCIIRFRGIKTKLREGREAYISVTADYIRGSCDIEEFMVYFNNYRVLLLTYDVILSELRHLNYEIETLKRSKKYE